MFSQNSGALPEYKRSVEVSNPFILFIKVCVIISECMLFRDRSFCELPKRFCEPAKEHLCIYKTS